MTDDKPRFGAVGEDPLDRAIDRAVREMMHVDPPAGLRRRVLSRIEARSPRPALFPRVAFAAAALAVLVLAVLVLRPGGPAPAVPQAVATGAQAPVTAAPPLPPAREPAAMVASGPPDAGRLGHRRDGLINMPRVRNVFGPPTGRIAGATITDAPIGTPLDESAVGSVPSAEDAREVPGVAPLRIAPLDVKPLQIAPLGLPK